MVKIVKQVALGLVVALAATQAQPAVENSSRYFPFSTRVEKVWHNPGFVADVDLFYNIGDGLAREDSPAIGLGDAAGAYDLKSLIFAMNKAGIEARDVSFLATSGPAVSTVLFKGLSTVQTGGANLRFAYTLPTNIPVTLGISVPVMTAKSDLNYAFDVAAYAAAGGLPTSSSLAPEDRAVIINTMNDRFDAARRISHDRLGLTKNYWTASGFGDIDLFARTNLLLDHRFLMKSIDLSLQTGVQIPTGVTRAIDNPASIPFMNDGHWGLYAQMAPTFELRQNLRVGFLARTQFLLPDTRERRLPVYAEPSFVSPLKGLVRVQPGVTFILSPFVRLENLYDGLHLQGRYTYKHHRADHWQDKREDKTIPSYLSMQPSPADGITQDSITNVINAKEHLSKYRSHYITIQLTYDPLEAQRELWLRPKFYASYEQPLFSWSHGVAESRQVCIGAELHF